MTPSTPRAGDDATAVTIPSPKAILESERYTDDLPWQRSSRARGIRAAEVEAGLDGGAVELCLVVATVVAAEDVPRIAAAAAGAQPGLPVQGDRVVDDGGTELGVDPVPSIGTAGVAADRAVGGVDARR